MPSSKRSEEEVKELAKKSMNNKHLVKVYVDNPKGKDYYAIRYKAYKYKKNFIKKRNEKVNNYLKLKKAEKANKQSARVDNATNINKELVRFSNKYDSEIKTKEDALKKLKEIKIKYEENSNITDELLVDNVKALCELHDEYAFDSKFLNKLVVDDLKDDSFALYNPNNGSITLNSKYFSNNKYLTSEMLKYRGNWFCNFNDNYINVYSIHHEFSHYLEIKSFEREGIKQIISGNILFNDFIEYDDTLWKDVHAGRYPIKNISQYG